MHAARAAGSHKGILQLYEGIALMKRVLKSVLLLSLITLISIVGFALAAGATTDNSQAPLEERLIGTWRWEDQHSWTLIFREDGTVLDGPPGMRTPYNWSVVNDRLIVDGEDWNVRITDNTLTADRYFGISYTYNWYSDSTEGEASIWGIVLACGAVFVVIAAVIGAVVFVLVRRSRRKAQQQMPFGQQAPPAPGAFGGPPQA